jgi:hypothetical protein
MAQVKRTGDVGGRYNNTVTIFRFEICIPLTGILFVIEIPFFLPHRDTTSLAAPADYKESRVLSSPYVRVGF